MKSEHIKYILLIIILGFAVYANSLSGKFVLDDDYLIKGNAYIRDWSHMANAFTKDIGRGAGVTYNFYRPLQTVTYMADYSLWKLNVYGYHLTNVFLHILAALSVYWLINALFSNGLLSFFTGILFVAHPVHTGAVAYISGRADSLACIFMLLCFVLYVKEGRLTLVALTYAAAVLSKESALILPVLILLYHYTFKKKLKVKEFSPIAGIALIYILLRVTILKSLLPHASYSSSLFQRMPGFFAALANYTKLLFLPFGLHMEYGRKLFQFSDPRVIVGVVISFSLLGYAVKKRKEKGLISFSILWFFASLLPVANLYPVSAYMAEHWLYLPSIGFFLLLSNGILSLRRAGVIIVIILVGFYSFLTIRQNDYWIEPIGFYKKTLEYTPKNARMLNNLGNEYRNLGRREEAMALYKKAIEANPDYAMPYNNLGGMHYGTDEREEGIALLERAIEINPDYAEAYNNLGAIYYDMGRPDEARRLYEKAIELNPNYKDALYNLSLLEPHRKK